MKLLVKAVALAAVILVSLQTTASGAEPVVNFGASDATSVDVISGTKSTQNAYWWDHTNLTVLVSSEPHADPAFVQALRDAIALWRSTLAQQLPQISLTDVTGKSNKADITLRYDPTFGGINWAGLARCSGAQKCNISVRSDLNQNSVKKQGEPPFTTLQVERNAIHELGHALGLGHAAPLNESTDLMAYGWIHPRPDLTPTLSTCDLNGIRAAFSWVFANEAPHPATVAAVQS